MKLDPRAQFIVDQLTAAAQEVKPGTPVPPMDADAVAVAMLNLAVNVFDRLLPMLVSAVIVGYRKQITND